MGGLILWNDPELRDHLSFLDKMEITWANFQHKQQIDQLVVLLRPQHILQLLHVEHVPIVYFYF